MVPHKSKCCWCLALSLLILSLTIFLAHMFGVKWNLNSVVSLSVVQPSGTETKPINNYVLQVAIAGD